MQIGEFLKVSAGGLEINPQAADDEDLVYFGEIGASLKAGPLNITGQAKDFAILGNGLFDAKPVRPGKPGFSVGFGLNNQKGVGLPSFLPIGGTVNAVWPNFNNDSANFTLDVSASVAVNVKAIQLKGSVTGLPPGTATQTFFGGVHFGYVDGSGNSVSIPANTTPDLNQTPFQITIQGGTGLSYLQGKQKLAMTGNVILTSRPNDLRIDAQVSTSLSGIVSIPNAVSGAAFFEITDTGFWGAAQVGANLD